MDSLGRRRAPPYAVVSTFPRRFGLASLFFFSFKKFEAGIENLLIVGIWTVCSSLFSFSLSCERYHAYGTNCSIDDSFLSFLQRTVSIIPRQATFLVEDIDCAFPSREELDLDSNSHMRLALGPMDHDVKMNMDMSGMVVEGKRATTKSCSEVTLSDLLNVLDGVGSEEGKIFFAPVCILPSRYDDVENGCNAS